MDKKAIIIQLVKLLEVNHIDCMEAKTLLRNTDYIDDLFVCEFGVALYWRINNKFNEQQEDVCKIIMDILEAIKED